MKITLWQQFSSNHSASFSVVGVFDSPEIAHESAAILRDIIERIGEHYRNRFPDVMDYIDWAKEIDVRTLSQLETTIRKEYKIRPRAWLTPLDWAYEDTPVSVFRNLVFVSSRGDTWAGFQPLDSLIKRFGGKFYAIQEGHGSCSFTLVCQAKDSKTAKQLKENLSVVETKYNFDYHYVQIPESLKFSAEIEVTGKQVSFTNMPIYASNRTDGNDSAKILTALIPYLESQDCITIQYKFKES